jgi:hypothetical protein
MRPDTPLILSVLALAGGVGLIFGFCDGNTGLTVGYPLAASVLVLHITTKGVPALVGLSLIGLGALLLVFAFLAAIIGHFKAHDAPLRRELPFEE